MTQSFVDRNDPAAARPSRRSVLRRAMACLLALLAAPSIAAAPAKSTKSAPSKSKPPPIERKSGQAIGVGAPGALAAGTLPDSIPEDLRAAWTLRARVGRAYWPEWLSVDPAPILIRTRTFDFLVNHPSPPGNFLAARPIPGGGGAFQTSMQQVPYGKDPRARVEVLGDRWVVPFEAEGGRPGARSDIATFLAFRDFLAYETRDAKPVWASTVDTTRVRMIRQDPDFRSWLDQEGLALKHAVAAGSEAERVAAARQGLAAWKKAKERVEDKPGLQALFEWIQLARQFEGPAQYLQVQLAAHARSVAAGDTAFALPAENAAYELRERAWQERAAASSDRQVQGAHLGAIREVGAYYAVLLDAWSPGWRKRAFDREFRLPDALEQALETLGNRKHGGG